MLTATRRSLVRRTRDLCFGRWGLLDWLRLLCCSAVLWYELGSFHYALRTCAWPDSALHTSQERPAHVLLVADPQVRDSATSRRVGYSALRQSIQDLVLKRNWHYAYSSRPDIVVFLGDILASWRLIRSDEEYERNLRKFQHIFRADEHVTAYYVPGNNDVGLNIEPAAARQARYRFTKHLGPLNQEVIVRNHSLVMLDAAGLVEEDYLRAAKYIDYDHWSPIPNGPVEFVRSLRDADQRPMALMTHIPLYRPDTASCGPLREKGTIRRGVGPGYQNTLGKKTTTFLLHTLQPDIVFSADDKDYCDYMHVPPKPIGAAAAASSPNASSQAVREVTLKAFSPASDIRHPGFQLLSLGTPPQPGAPNLASQPCFLPDYANVYAWRYTPLVLTVLVLMLLRARNARASPLPLHARRGALRRSFSIHTLPADAPWLPLPRAHPPTPLSPDWSPHTPGFVSPHREAHGHGHRSPRASLSPTDELARGIRTPVPPRASSPGGSSGGGASAAELAPATPTFRATTHSREPSLSLGLGLGAGLTRLIIPSAAADADADADEHEHDEFARGRHDPRRLSRIERGADRDADADARAPALGFTFTLGGLRRRVSFGALVPRWARGGLRAGARRAFAWRVGADMVYVVWPALVLWAACLWRLS